MVSHMKKFIPEIILVLVFMGMHIGYLGFPPPNPDVGGITYNGMLLNNGLVPYRDSFEQKLPGAFFIVGGIIGIFGVSVTALNVIGMIWNTVHLLVILWGTRRLFGIGASRWAGTAFIFAIAASASEGFCPSYELWMTLPVTAGLFILLLKPSEQWKWLLGAGLLMSMGSLAKQQVIFSLLPAVLWAIRAIGGARQKTIRSIAWLIAGGIIPVAAILVYFLCAGELQTFLSMIDPRNAMVYAAGGRSPGWIIWHVARQETTSILNAMPLIYYAGTSFLIMTVWKLVRSRKITFETSFIFLWIFGAAFGVVSGMRFYSHYYLQLVPVLCVTVGWLYVSLSRHTSSTNRLVIHVTFAAILLWASLGEFIRHGRMAWWQTKYAIQGKQMPRVVKQKIADMIELKTPPDSPILVWGHAEDMYFICDRLAPTRYYKYYAFLMPPPTNFAYPQINTAAREHITRYLEEIMGNLPSAVIVTSAMSSAPIDILPAFRDWLLSHYALKMAEDEHELWLRKERITIPDTPHPSS